MDGWENCKLNSVIVPLPSKVYLDAVEARFIFKNILTSDEYGLDANGIYVVKIFIATSRTYKDYIAKGDMHPEVKEYFLNLPMSKFIYVAEISDTKTFKKGMCNGVLLLDATELSLKEGEGIPMSFLAGYNKVSPQKRVKRDLDGLFFRQDFGNFNKVGTFARPFETFGENLM